MAFKPDVVQVLPIIEKLEKFINNAEYYPARNSYRGMVVLGLVSKALTVGRAVCSLISSGFPGEAFGMSRTLIDICFTARYISNNDTEERAKRFAEFYSKDHEGWTKIITKFYPATTITESEFHRDALEMARAYKSAHQWTGMGDQTRQMAMEPDTYECDANNQGFNCEYDYEVIYKWTSFFVHSTVSGLESHFMEFGEPFRVHARSKLETERGEEALVNVLVYLSRIFIHASRAQRDDAPQTILEEIQALLHSYV